MQRSLLTCVSILLYGALAVGGSWLLLRFLLPWLAPFLLAFVLAGILERPVAALQRRGLPRPAGAAAMSLGLLGALSWALAELAGRGLAALERLAGQTPRLVEGLSRGLTALEEKLLCLLSPAPGELSQELRTALEGVGALLYALPERLSRLVLELLGRAAQNSPNVLLFAVTAGIGTYFLSASFPKTRAFLLAQLPERVRARLEELGEDLKASFGGLLRTQLMLMAMTFFELLLAFLLMKIPGAPGLAAITALVDALPVFGAGTILLPWAAGCLLLGELRRGLGLALCWALVTLLRSCVQAKLLGDQIGLDPLASLLSIYVGWQLGRVWGMLLCPLLLVTLQQLHERGVIRLWRDAE